MELRDYQAQQVEAYLDEGPPSRRVSQDPELHVLQNKLDVLLAQVCLIRKSAHFGINAQLSL